MVRQPCRRYCAHADGGRIRPEGYGLYVLEFQGEEQVGVVGRPAGVKVGRNRQRAGLDEAVRVQVVDKHLTQNRLDPGVATRLYWRLPFASERGRRGIGDGDDSGEGAVRGQDVA